MTYPYRTVTPWAIWSCDPFGDDSEGNYIWEKFTPARDLTLGDGSTASTFPTFTTDEPGVSYYEFDGVDDYLSNWPDMPTSYVVSAAMSDSYPDGQPYIMQYDDTTIETLLTTPGSFTGNLHNLVIFDEVISAEEKLAWADYQLRRCWRDTYINPYTARLIRNGDDIQEYVFTVSGDPYNDYSDTGATPSPSGITWNGGLTFDTGASVVTVSDEAALRSDEISIFVSGVFAGGHVVDKGTNYELSAVYAAGSVLITVNGVASSVIPVTNLYSLGVTMTDGGHPTFYVNGREIETAVGSVTVDDTDTNDLLIGNQSGGSDEFTGTFKRLSIFNRELIAAEMFMLHRAAMADFE